MKLRFESLSDDSDELWPSDMEGRFMLSWILISGLIGSLCFPLAIYIIGFTFKGVMGSSPASRFQSYHYGGETGGCFSCCQSLGTKLNTMAIIGFIIGAISGGFVAHEIYENHH
ncbi:Oidioi.mRNA.OKI2018_I69.PAR.g12828.t1.cds [Oikopleura dioica]|uniref:Oidioi.mRNA.OKI2018_I69.PAR.g12828.t1.cds n=1 Tax=Oikopleura dioica TaxID=34765 RepID=A0ABN7S1U6_OIKDI|nr:Oidioi.mRNA.OKI2018_I69.PAR.g12828.t1.cds [Oikopleura dioica]